MKIVLLDVLVPSNFREEELLVILNSALQKAPYNLGVFNYHCGVVRKYEHKRQDDVDEPG